MAILIDQDTRVIIQGATGKTGRLFVERMSASATPVVAGVTPGKGGTSVAGVPVFDGIAEAVERTGGNAVLSCISPRFIVDGVHEVVAADVPLMILYVENIPVHDAIHLCAHARARGTQILGPNSAGAVSPGMANLSDLNDANLRPGRVGIVSKSGTLTYEVIDALHDQDLGESSVVCLGGDRVIGTNYLDILTRFEDDPDTDLVVVVGEPGGGLEIPAAQYASTMMTPVVAYITGRLSPPDTRMGHAGAVVGDDERSQPATKIAAFERFGIPVARRVTDIGELVLDRLRTSAPSPLSSEAATAMRGRA